MNNKMIGLLIMLLVPALLIFRVSQGNVHGFISIDSLIFIIALGGGMTYMNKHNLSEHKLGTAIKDNFITAGWLGTVVGLIIMLPNIEFSDPQFRIGLAAAIVTILYGYILGAIAQAFIDK
tara:strand:+ start:178 stop:540 length:363 start_codon:yes stop_codon:yes gene_type:complete